MGSMVGLWVQWWVYGVNGDQWGQWWVYGVYGSGVTPPAPHSPTVTPVSSSVPVNVSFWGVPRPRCPLLDGQRLRLEETRPCLNVRPCPAPHED
ncbi:hypothetical protein AV530_007092 [Patagioenas fasciata monilis]|uniref:Secreted protein n=1 Tax=Patagioenas fasciata monilis TaxID=372326 RepID=A0A1V4JGM7_PATFA|nr:hypothetical protein AV530_007092 [Patagioenas fasciata monilis]